MLRPLTVALALGVKSAKATGCISSSRCKITRHGGSMGLKPTLAPKRNSIKDEH